jgi:hypothetical protein
MARRCGVSAETPHVDPIDVRAIGPGGGESVVGHLDRPQNRPLVEAAADSTRVARLRAGTP